METAKITNKIHCPHCGYKDKGIWAIDFKYLDVEHVCSKCHRKSIIPAGSVERSKDGEA